MKVHVKICYRVYGTSSYFNLKPVKFPGVFKMQALYTLLLYLLSPLLLLRLYIRGRRLPAYKKRIGERFRRLQVMPHDVWIHAVSLGEAVLISPLIDELLARNLRVFVTVMTPTGSQHIEARFGQRVGHQYAPYDFPHLWRHFFRKLDAKFGIIVETELWPNMIRAAKKQNMQLFLANARISDRAWPQYLRLRKFFQGVLTWFDGIWAQSTDNAERFIRLGARETSVTVPGNLKFDAAPASEVPEFITDLRVRWGGAREVLVAASTHEGEEVLLLEALPCLKEICPDLLLILVPRHPERFVDVAYLAEGKGFITARRSMPDMLNHVTEVLIVDSLGELAAFYTVADLAFVGGSLVPVGGHNVLEPAAANVPVLTGPYINNAKAVILEMQAKGAIIVADGIEDLVQHLITLLQNPSVREAQREAAQSILATNRGAIARCLTALGI